MQPEVKLSKFTFHLKFSRKKDYLHEHELYEVMRSRNLYQYQFSVRSNFQKKMRNIEISEKAQKYLFENSRKLFVQKMRERREQADKLRDKNNSLMKKLRKEPDETKLKRRYVPMPASTNVYEELPPIMPKVKSPVVSHDSILLRSEDDESRGSSAVQAPPTPSAVAGTIISAHVGNVKKERSTTQEEPTKAGANTLALPVKKKEATDVRSVQGDRKGSIYEKVYRDFGVDTENLDRNEKDNVDDEFGEAFEEYERKRREFESNAIKGHGKQHTSAVHFSEEPPTDNAKSQNEAQTFTDTVSKIEAWRERHGLVSKADIEKDTTFERLLIDRPSKWALSHVHHDSGQSTELGMRYQMLKTSLRKFDTTFKKKSQKLDDLSIKLGIKSKQNLSLPELDTTPKPMVTLDPGGTTPDGRLILTKADYEDYLSDYRKARVTRLERSKKKTKLLHKMIENFSLDPTHRLHDETDMKSGIHTI